MALVRYIGDRLVEKGKSGPSKSRAMWQIPECSRDAMFPRRKEHFALAHEIDGEWGVFIFYTERSSGRVSSICSLAFRSRIRHSQRKWKSISRPIFLFKEEGLKPGSVDISARFEQGHFGKVRCTRLL